MDQEKRDNLRGAIYAEYRNLSEFCRASGVPRATIDNVLKGYNEPLRETIQMICAALKKPSTEQKFHYFF